MLTQRTPASTRRRARRNFFVASGRSLVVEGGSPSEASVYRSSMRGSSCARSIAAANLPLVRMPTACCVKESCASIMPLRSSSRRRRSRLASRFVRSANRSSGRSALSVSEVAWLLPRRVSSPTIPGSSGRSKRCEMSGRNGASAGPRKPGRALLRTKGRPCIRSTNEGAVSAAEPFSLPTTQPIAGRPPRFARFFASKPLWH